MNNQEKSLVYIFVIVAFLIGAPVFLSVYRGTIAMYLPPPLTQVAQVAVPTSGLIAHYTFDDVTASDSVGGMNGAVSGGVSSVTGVIGGALQFNGTDGIVNIPTFAGISGASAVTISFWMKPDVTGKGIMSQWGSGRLLDMSLLGSSFRAIWRYGGSAGAGKSLDSVASGAVAGQWQHVVIQYDGAQAIVYKDGAQVGTVSGDGGALNSGVTDAFKIGANSSGSYYSGALDDVRIYSRSLNSSEIQALFSAGGGVVGSGGNDTSTQTPPVSTTPTTQTPTSGAGGTQTTTTTGTITPVAGPITYYVSSTGDDSNMGTQSSPLKTVQKCADVVRAGNTCLVMPGTYDEKPVIRSSGTSGAKITFKPSSSATIKGFEIRGDYIRVEGFTYTGLMLNFQGIVISTGNYDEIVGNTIFNPTVPSSFYGLQVDGSYTTVSRNIITGMQIGTAINVTGVRNTIENNIIKDSSDIDVFRVFGHDHVIRGNLIQNIKDGPLSNHIDFIQSFGSNGNDGYNISIENNFVDGLEGQLSQIEQGCGLDSNGSNSLGNICSQMPGVNGSVSAVSGNTLTDTSVNWITGKWLANHWQGAVVTMTSGTAFAKIYLITGSTGNTLSVSRLDGGSVNLASDGVRVGDTYEIRMRIGWWTWKNNVFKDVTLGSSVSNPYIVYINNTFYNQPVGMAAGGTTDRGWAFYMKVADNVFLNNRSGNLLYAVYDQLPKPTFYAGYNYVAGMPTTYSPKDDSATRCAAETYAFQYFCEVRNGQHGINGGDPKFRDVNNPLGPDGIPFTLDDGLKPLPGSILCGAGENGTDLGAYSCNPGIVNSSGGNPSSFPIDTTVNISTPTPDTQIPAVDTTPAPTSVYYVSTNGSDANPGTSNAPFRTIQKCANTVKSGGQCFVSAGVYPEHVETASGGSSGSYVMFKASGVVTMKGFRIKHPYIRIEGFDITKYDVGLDQGHIAVEPEGDGCQIINNTIRDGIYLTSTNLYFDATTKTITNPSGGFLAAGFVPGVSIYIGSNINSQILNHDNNGGSPYRYENKIVRAVTDKTLTLDSSNTVFTEGPVSSTIYVNKAEKNGIWGIMFLSASGRGQPDNCLVQGNHLYNLAGKGIQIQGNDNVVERNTLDHMNGWRMIAFYGNRNVFRFNVFRDSPRWPNFELPKPGTIFSTGSGSWDMYDTLMTSTATVDQTVNDNRFEYNFIKDIDEQFASVEATAPGGAPLENKGLIIRNNIFVNMEMSGSSSRPGTIVQNNTFYKNAWRSAHNFIVGKGSHGNPIDSMIKNNAFVESGNQLDTSGWYSTYSDEYKPTPGVLADYNFVAGPALNGYSAKSTFVSSGLESHGINGGNPLFKNQSNPFGSDGIPFTLDDGLKPQSGSPLCGKGEGGIDIGAYSCDSNVVFSIAGGSQMQTNTPLAPVAGDFNADGRVNSLDFSLLQGSWNRSSTTYDLNKDGIVNTLDYALMIKNWTG